MDPAVTDSFSLKEVVGWFFGGLAAIGSTIATAMVGKIWKQHNEMYKSFSVSNDPKTEKLEAEIEKAKQDSLDKYHKDVADIKHQFSQLQTQVGPILKRMAEEEHSIIELMTGIVQRLDKLEIRNKK